MAEYLHPGVYIEETSYRSPPLEGVSTSTAGLVGRTRKGPEGKPTLVTSFTEFVRTFGDPFPVGTGTTPQLGDYLGHAVRAFFDNGGKRAYIVRALANDATPATIPTNLGQVYLLPGTTTVRGPTATVPLNSVRGLDGGPTGTKLDVYSRASNGTATYRFTIQVSSVDLTRNTITLVTPLGAGLTLSPASTFMNVSGTGLTLPASTTKFTALSRGLDGNDISVQFRPSEGSAMKVVTQRFFRTKPQIAAFSGQPGNIGPTGVTPIPTISLPSLGLALPGDTIAFDGPNSEKTAITSVAFSGPLPLPTTMTVSALGSPVSAAAGDVITLTARGLTSTATPAPIYKLATGDSINGLALATQLELPYGLASMLDGTDQIVINGVTVTIGSPADFDPTTHPNTVTVTLPGLANIHPTTNVTIDATGDIDTTTFTKRLLVGDTTGLAAPFALGPTPQQIVITDGTTSVQASVLLVDGARNTVVVQGTGALPANWTSFELLQVTGASAAVPVASTSGFYTGAIVELFDGLIGNYFTVAAIDSGARLVTLNTTPPPIQVPADPNARNVFLRVLEMDALVYEGGTLVETFAGLTWNPDPTTDSFRRYYPLVINDPDNGSELVGVQVTASSPDPGGQPNTPDGFPLALSGGTNGSPLDDIAIIGKDLGPGARTGIQALKEKSDIALIAVPGVTDQEVQQELLTQCENLKYRFAILDGKQGVSDISQIEAHRGNYDSHYGGYYAPWLKTIDVNTGNTMLAPPSGYVLGICARVDNARGVFKAPANEVVQNILDVELPFTDGEQDVLNPLGINLIRAFETRGIRVWGARTTTSDSEWRYINVRRLFIFLEHSIDNGTQFVVFEPNNEALWERVKESIESFLFGVWKTGALMGTKPEDAYFVRCDRTTMTQDDIDNGRLVCLIGVAPTYPAEFVIFRIGQFTASTNQA